MLSKGQQINGQIKSKIFCSMVFVIFITGIIILSFESFWSQTIVIKNSGTIVTVLPLHVDGRYVKDSENRTIRLRGMNAGHQFVDHPNGWWTPRGQGYLAGYGVWDPEAVQYNLDKMKEWGINILRMHTVIEWWLADNLSYRQHIKDTITWAGERGIYVIFEPCFVRGPPNQWQFALPYYPYLIYDAEHTNLPEDAAIMPNREAFIDYWVSVVNELKGYTNVLFEVYNEPHGNSTIKAEFFDMVQEWIDAVRNAGATQILIVQWGYSIDMNLDYPSETIYTSIRWVEDYPLNDPLNNIMYSFHLYRGDIHRSEPSYLACYTYEDMLLGLQYCLVDYVLNNLSKPVICGEIGANMWHTGEELQRELAWLNNTLTIFNEWGVAYLYYSWAIPVHMRHGCLSNGYVWCPPPNEAGTVLINNINK